MIRVRRLIAALLVVFALPLSTGAQNASLRPFARPQVAVVPPLPQVTVQSTDAKVANLRPPPRSQNIALPPAPLMTTVPVSRPKPRPTRRMTDSPRPLIVQPLVSAQPDASIRRYASLRPRPRPGPVPTPDAMGPADGTAAPAQSAAQPVSMPKPERRKKAEKVSRKGSVCGLAAIKGEQIARITSSVTGCGIAEPVQVTSVSGVRLSQPATLDCTTAKALNRWIETGLQPAFGRKKVVEVRVAAHYICRSRNNVKGAKISEHGRGKAIDIAGVVLADGSTVSVLGGYGRELRRAYKAACGTFGTTLGPGSDGYHEDHMHFDTASHRSGPYCR